MTGIDQHVRGERIDVIGHACPDCPQPVARLQVAPNPFCRWCQGTGVVSTAMLAAWQAAQNARVQAGG